MNENTKAIISKCAYLCEKVYSEEADWLYNETLPGCRILAIEGTKEKTDWFYNLRFLFRDRDMHRGFKANAERTLVSLIANGEPLPKERRLVLTGHSLGGASAACLANLLRDRYPDLMLVTFGSPRPGGSKVKRNLKFIEQYRFRHADDVVPRTPPWFLGYVHPSPVIHLPEAEWRLYGGVHNHNIGLYRNQVEKYLYN